MPTQTARLLKRLRNDFQLSIITLMGLFGVIGISPYAVYRLLEGNYLVGIADTIIVLSTLFAVRYAWLTRDTVKPGIFLAAVLSIAATLIAINLGVNGLFWIYPLILFNFFMVTPGKALLASSLVLGSLTSHALLIPGSVFESHYQMVSFLVTCLMASVLSFIFAFRTRTQRDQLQSLAIHDPLTGARNRRAMNEELKIAMASHRRHSDSYGLLVMDLDHFKQINDRFGHHVGDQVLVAFVELIMRCSRKEDRLFRFGGEEFLLLLPNTDTEGLRTAARHLLDKVASELQSPGGAVTVSIGGAILHSGEHWENWLQRADECLYRAKSEGRNRAVIADAPNGQSKAATSH
ncbi:GGDEF domain-containing protein [Ectopseudomonas oleovorans]|uniref:diguanylate cyclase n=1 Tax=Ectopseudomonas oleovorans TaxID=301 RepID=A0AA42Q6H2_ECTOL|nr:GGDEF domain-containing protein [Pseudomonas oleovorans]MDH1337962.1 GGDEF domain-containing protein [Pseudomonas oleovorans]MDH1491073.1 GGDEF domain-containing protein [Pseudomonas oleovorans]WGG19901.1 GGDEF domain-containing protein [Pseudomonas oleovorans]